MILKVRIYLFVDIRQWSYLINSTKVVRELKTLVFFREDQLKPIGGPCGYLYNLKLIRDFYKDKEIFFLNNMRKECSYLYLLKYLPYKICHIFTDKFKADNPLLLSVNDIIYKSKLKGRVDFSKFDIIHFHSVLDLFSQKANLINFKGKVVLTSHSPKSTYQELIEDVLDKEDYIENYETYSKVKEMDEFAFKISDYIVFPCPGAEEPYFHTWPEYHQLRNPGKIVYIPTGIYKVKCTRSREEIRNLYDIPPSAFVISFVGRHNLVKGYDILIEIFRRMSDIYVISCGNQSNIKPPYSERWIEVGWTDDPYSIVGASDLFLLPNRETYFDIAMLQTLSIGKCSVISDTGGNKEFISTPGVKLFKSVDEAISSINFFRRLPLSEKKILESQQISEFENKYDIEIFYRSYKEFLRKITH